MSEHVSFQEKASALMAIRRINAEDGAGVFGAYVQAIEVKDTTRRVYVSGQAPVRTDGTLPDTFRGQAEAVWSNILAQLRAADMDAENIVKATTFLVDRKYRDENRDVRMEMLGGHTFALTVVLAGMFEDGWLLEIDAIAEK
ncbi:MAG: RidA family protein [Pseudomonadota bacterium]